MNQKAKARLLEKEDPTGGTLPDMRRRNRGLIYVKNRCPMHISDNGNTHRHLVEYVGIGDQPSALGAPEMISVPSCFLSAIHAI